MSIQNYANSAIKISEEALKNIRENVFIKSPKTIQYENQYGNIKIDNDIYKDDNYQFEY